MAISLKKSFFLAFTLATFSNPLFSEPAQNKEDVEAIIRNLIEKEPELIGKAKDVLKQRKLQEKKTKIAQIISGYRNSIFERSGDPIAGNLEGDVTIVMFQDYRCGHCKMAHKIMTEVIENDKNLRVVFKEYPVLGPDSIYAAKASLAALKQGRDKQTKFSESMMSASDPVSKDEILTLAEKSGLNLDQLKKDIGNSDVDQSIVENLKIGRTLDIQGTPSYVIGASGEEEVRTGVLEKDEVQDLIKKIREKLVRA